MKDMVTEMGLSKSDLITKSDVFKWFSSNYPKIKQNTVNCHLIRMSTNGKSRHHYNAKIGEDDLLYQVNKNTFRLYQPTSDPSPLGSEIFQENENESGTEVEITENTLDLREFAYEKDLQNYLSKNLDLIEPGLSLYEEDGITGIEYPAGGRFIDILAIDRNNNYVVIELKVSRGYDRVIGQLLRYVSWVKKNITENNQTVRGVIIAREISEDLTLVCEELNNVNLFEYQLSVQLNKI
jgi:hypothetical protein